MNKTTSDKTIDNINPESVKTGADLFIFLFNCPTTFLKSPWVAFYHKLLSGKTSLRSILNHLHNILLKGKQMQNQRYEIGALIAENVLEIIRERFNLKHSIVEDLTEQGGNTDKDIIDAHRVLNHPVHIMDVNNNLSPSAFIPFCEIGGNMSLMGKKIDLFPIPVCNSFNSTILNDQLCYELEPEKIISSSNIEDDLGLGLIFAIDYNIDRQIRLHEHEHDSQKQESFGIEIIETSQELQIYLDTLGNYFH